MPAKGRLLSMQLLATDMKRREEKLGANVQLQLPLPGTTGDAWRSVLM